MSGLPKGWAAARLIDVTSIKTGKLDANAANIDGQYPFFTCAEEISRINTYSFDTNAVLLAGNGFFNVKRFKGKFDAYQRTYVIEPLEIDVDFLYQVFQYLLPVIASKSRGSTIKYLRIGDIQNIEFKLPPAAEQTRIVAKLEELLSSLDAGVAELKAAQKKLVQYRQSLLKAAVEGTLTKAWRDATPASETGQALLVRILKERRARWEAKQLLKFAAAGKAPPKDWQKKYPEPAKPDTTGLATLPEGWVWASLDMLGHIASGVTKGTKRSAAVVLREVPYLRVANVQRGYLDLTEVKTIEATLAEIEELALVRGDILFNEGGDRDKLGRGWVWANEVENCIHQNHVYRMRPYLPEVVSEVISHHSNSFGQKWFEKAGKQTTNLASINMGVLRSFPVPVAPADEQQEILLQIREKLEALDRQEQVVEHSLKQSAAQRKNILQAAFAGRLVAQDPKDEPASVLLARIAKERVSSKQKGGSKA